MAGGGGGVGGRLDSCMKADVWVMVTLSGSILLSLFNRSKGSKPETKTKKQHKVILKLNILIITVLSIIDCWLSLIALRTHLLVENDYIF